MSKRNDYHLNVLNERLQELKQLIHDFLMSVGSLNSSGRSDNAKAGTEKIHAKSKIIFDLLAQNDRPDWLNRLPQVIENYKANSYDPQFFLELVPIINAIKEYRWNESEISPSEGINFDDLFNDYRKNGKLDTAIDEILTCLREVLTLGEKNDISKSLYEDLVSLLKTVEFSKSSSRASVESSLYLVWDFFKSVFFAVNPHLAGIEKIVESVEKIGVHVASANDEIQSIDVSVQAKVNERMSRGKVKLLAHTYDHKASILPDDIRPRINMKT